MAVATEIFSDLAVLPPDAQALLDDAGRENFFLGPAWWRTMLAAGMQPDALPQFVVCRDDGRTVALLALQARPGGLESLTNPYTCLYAPLLAPGLDAATIRAVGQALAGICRRQAVVRLDALAEDVPRDLLDGLRTGGLLVRRFDQFGNWFEPVEGLSWAAYLQVRPGELRETVRRRLRRAAREKITFRIVADPGEVESGIAEYEAVYARSWKVAEPFPHFNAELMRQASAIGALRLAILSAPAAGGPAMPIAVQLWVVCGGRAHVLKLAHDTAFRALSPGTLLTAMTLRALLDGGPIRVLDFGRGDDAYKQLWTGSRRQRIGLLLIDPRRPAGLAALARQSLGDLRRRLLGRG